MTTNWSRAEESNFQELCRRAEAQSRECYLRAGKTTVDTTSVSTWEPAPTGMPEPQALPEPKEPEIPIHQPLVCLPTPAPPSKRSESSMGQPKACPDLRPHPAPPSRGSKSSGIAGLLGGLDIETLLLCGLLWLLWEEDADWKVLAALAYILLV